MNRRRFLTLTGLCAGGAMAARGEAGVRLTESQRTAGSRRAAEALERAVTEAANRGKPLILIPIPVDSAEAEQIQSAWGELFSSPDDEQLSLLALFDFAFASLPPDAVFDSATQCALYRTTVKGAWRPLPLVEGDPSAPRTLGRSLVATFLSTQEKRVDLFTLAARGATWPGTSPRANFATPETAPRLKLEEVDRGAALLYARIESSEDEEFKRWGRGLLASAAAQRLYENDPFGAQWKWTYPEVEPCPPCGMAIVPKTSKLFLDTYTSQSR